MPPPAFPDHAARRFPYLVATALAIGVAVFSLQYLRPGMPDGFVQQLALFRAHAGWFRLHLVAGAIALALGPFQFLAGWRARRPGFHRWMGRLYAGCVAVSAIAGFYLAGLSYAGWPTHLAFYGLTVLWLVTTGNAVRLILGGDVAAHQRWMLRSYALTFAAVTLRLWLAGFILAGVSFDNAYIMASWLGWVPNLIFVDVYLRRSRASGQDHGTPHP